MKRTAYITILLLCAGCLRNDPEMRPAGGNIVTFGIEASNAGTRAVTPGDDALNENLVSEVDVFFYDAAGATCLNYPADSRVTLNAGNRTVTVEITDVATAALNTPVTLYMIANCGIPRDQLAGKTLEELQGVVFTGSATLNPAVFAAQESFLMDGKLEGVVITEGAPTIAGPLVLRRAAAKIAVNLTNTAVEGYQAVGAQIRLSNYLDKTALGSDVPAYTPADGDYKTSGWRDMYLPAEDPDKKNDPFYSYANDWEFGPARESYITIAIDWRPLDSPDSKRYYYRIPFNYIPPDPDDDKLFRLRRNYIYGFDVDVTELGGVDPEETLELTPSFTLRDWTTDRIEVQLNTFDYLVVNGRRILIHNIREREITYVSSSPITIESARTWHYNYLKSGVIQEVTVANPPITVVGNTIKVAFADIPDNFVPRNLDFTVRNESGLKQMVTVIQYTSISSRPPQPDQ